MDKPRPTNGFTMLECLLVLLIISILSISIPKMTYKDTMEITMKNITNLCVYVQEKAFIHKKDTYIHFNEDFIVFEDYEYVLPSSISCDMTSLYFNEKGNINHGQSIHCHKGNTSYKLIFQLGSGRVRYEKE